MKYIMMAVPERAPFIRCVRDQLPDLEVVFDKTRSAVDTMCAAFRAAGNERAVFMEDDVQLCEDFEAKVEEAVFNVGRHPVKFFSRLKDDALVGSRWLPPSAWMMNQCFYLPAGMGTEIADLRDAEGTDGGYPHNTEGVIMAYLKKNKIKYWNHVPSLVEHIECKSVVDPKRSTKRQAKIFAGA